MLISHSALLLVGVLFFCLEKGNAWQISQTPSQQRHSLLPARRNANNDTPLVHAHHESRREMLQRVPTSLLLGTVTALVTTTPTTSATTSTTTRAGFFQSIVGVPPAWARAPGSRDLSESTAQIQDAAAALKGLQQNFDDYATVDAEGRAGSTDAARRILGGIAPQSGSVAIEVAKATPLYRIDGAFKAVRFAAIDGDDDNGTTKWTENLDLSRFEELVERILFALQKADGDFYSVLFASKGTKQIQGIYKEAKIQVDQCVKDLEEMIQLFKDAGAPGF